MKKKVLFKLSFVAFVLAMIINVHMNKVQSTSDFALENIQAVAMASGEGWEDDCEPVWENVSCSSGGVSYTYMKKK